MGGTQKRIPDGMMDVSSISQWSHILSKVLLPVIATLLLLLSQMPVIGQLRRTISIVWQSQ